MGVGVVVAVGKGGSGVGVKVFSATGGGVAGIDAEDSAAHPARKRIIIILKKTNFGGCI
jgi:hypothetical protein